MGNFTAEEIASKLQADRFSSAGPQATAASDPIADTPMVVTLDELRPYEHNPRVTRNPLYEDIKTSIRERGLDAPPSITRRPGAPHFVIRNGGNTRLAILRELWAETKAERFFRIPCLYRPWPARGEIIALTGHLAENELHGGLSFIERALGVAKARELYEQEIGAALSQSELSRRLTADGYPVAQPHISRMQDAVEYLLPAIPNVLYAGLGRPLVERLTALRRAAARTWEARAAAARPTTDFLALFHEVLTQFDAPDDFSVQRVQDELIGQMAELLHADYDALTWEIDDTERRQRVLGSEPSRPTGAKRPAQSGESAHAPPERTSPAAPSNASAATPTSAASRAPLNAPTAGSQPIVSAGRTQPDAAPTPSPNRPMPTREPSAASGLDAPADVRIRLAQLAQEITAELGLPNLANELTPLLLGERTGVGKPRLTDDGLVKLIELLQLARRLVELDNQREELGMESSAP